MEIRVANSNDTKQILEIYKPQILNTPNSFEEVVPSLQDFQKRIETIQKKFPYLVAEENGKVIGYAYASAHSERAAYRWSVNVSVYIDNRAHRKGVGTALYTKLFSILRELGYFKAYAGIASTNEASLRLHEKFGFKPIARYENVGYKFGKWHTNIWMDLTLQEPHLNPEHPKKFEG